MTREHWLDRLSKVLAQGTSRKEFLELLAALAVGPFVTRADVAEAKKAGGKGKHKDRDEVCQICGGPISPFCCNGACCSGGECCSGACCPALSACCNGTCCLGTCCSGNCCDGQCCNGSCCDGECKDGRCVTDPCSGVFCSAGSTCCGGVCIDVSLDDDNCGACGHACKGAAQCFGGRCVCPAHSRDFLPFAPKCDDPDLLCCASENSDTAACVNIKTDDQNCGGCRIDCTKSGKHCVAGTCQNCDQVVSDRVVDGACRCGAGPPCDFSKGQVCFLAHCVCACSPFSDLRPGCQLCELRRTAESYAATSCATDAFCVHTPIGTTCAGGAFGVPPNKFDPICTGTSVPPFP